VLAVGRKKVVINGVSVTDFLCYRRYSYSKKSIALTPLISSAVIIAMFVSSPMTITGVILKY